MAQPIPVTPAANAQTRVITQLSDAYGHAVHMVTLAPREVPRAMCEFPVLLSKNPANEQFDLVALLGFDVGENLFLDGTAWTGHYTPLHFRRGPFSVAPAPAPGEDGKPVLVPHIDMDDPRVQAHEGEALYDENREPTAWHLQINRVLAELVQGAGQMHGFVQALQTYDLIEPMRVQVAFESGKTVAFSELFTVNADRLAGLDAAALGVLHAPGYLRLAHNVIASQGQVGMLVARRNARDQRA